MGDISAEPSMEEILSSIKRIIEEEGEAAVTSPRARRAVRSAAVSRADIGDDEVLELNDAVTEAPAPRPTAARGAAPAEPVEEEKAETIVSPQAAEASRGSLDALSRMMVRPQSGGADTLEGLVREMLRPMLKQWLDANLPQMVEAMVAREIARITGRD